MATFCKAIPVTTRACLIPLRMATGFLEYLGSTTLASLAALHSTPDRWMIPITGPTLDMACNLAWSAPQTVAMQAAVLGPFVYLRLYHILICHCGSHTILLDVTYITISTAGFDALIPSLYFGLIRPLLSYHTTAHLYFATLHPNLHTHCFFAFLTLLIATSVQIITSQAICSQLGCLFNSILSQHHLSVIL